MLNAKHRQGKFIKRTVDDLVKLIKENNNHLTTGFLGTPDLCTVLSQYGYNDLAYMLIQLIIKPEIGHGIDFIHVEHESIYGRISCHWRKIEDCKISINVKIPANTTASVYLPCRSIDDIFENKKELYTAEGIKNCEVIDKILKIDMGSGEYEFLFNSNAV